MGWESSNRRSRLPANWEQLRSAIRSRAATLRHPGGQCEQIKASTGNRCTNPGRDVDHVTPGDDHDLSNLRLLCTWHHGKKSSSEGNAALTQRRASARRAPERHPGARK